MDDFPSVIPDVHAWHERSYASTRSILMFFGIWGDLVFLYRSLSSNGFRREIVASRSLERQDATVWYHTLRLTPAE